MCAARVDTTSGCAAVVGIRADYHLLGTEPEQVRELRNEAWFLEMPVGVDRELLRCGTEDVPPAWEVFVLVPG